MGVSHLSWYSTGCVLVISDDLPSIEQKLWELGDWLMKRNSAGIAWYFLLVLQLKLLSMEKLRVEKMTRIYSEAYACFCNLLYLFPRLVLDANIHCQSEFHLIIWASAIFSGLQMSNQARWAVSQSYSLLKWHKDAHQAAVKALERGGSLSSVIRSIEGALSS